MPASQRSRELDFLRFVAVCLVFLRHFAPLPAGTPAWFGCLVSVGVRAGWIGVDLFFVLSGYLISGLLFREYRQYERIDFKTFFVRRGLKIYPPFYLLILATVTAGVVQGWHIPWKKLVPELFFFQNYVTGLWTHTWSLAIEEHFYLLLPWLLIALARRSRGGPNPFRALPGLFVGVAGLLLALRAVTAWGDRGLHLDLAALCHRELYPTHLRIDSLFFGVVLSYFHHFHPTRLIGWTDRHRGRLALGAVLALSPTACLELASSPFLYTFGFTLVYLGMGAVLLLCVVYGLPRSPLTGPLFRVGAFVGAHSYSVYLWHMPVAILTDIILVRHLHAPWWCQLGVFVIGSMVVGVALSKLVEMPALALRDRLFPSRSKPFMDLKCRALATRVG